jgi:hypothetical protein
VSCSLTAHVLDLAVEPTTKLILLAVSECAHVEDGHDLYRPDEPRLSWLTSVPEQNIHRVLDSLQDSGVLTKANSGFYTVNLDSLPKLGRFTDARKRGAGR